MLAPAVLWLGIAVVVCVRLRESQLVYSKGTGRSDCCRPSATSATSARVWEGASVGGKEFVSTGRAVTMRYR